MNSNLSSLRYGRGRMTRRNEKENGFTLVELLVVLAVIGILIGLMMPAIQAAREAARRMSCQNNLSQLSLALHNYESTFRHLPSGYLHKFGPAGSGDEAANHMGLSWAAAMLPQLEQGAVARRINYDVPLWAESNRAARDISLPVFLCPSDTYSDSAFVYRAPEERYAAASYAANWGPADANTNLDATPLASRGVFFSQQQTTSVGIVGWIVQHACVRRATQRSHPPKSFHGGWTHRLRKCLDRCCSRCR